MTSQEDAPAVVITVPGGVRYLVSEALAAAAHQASRRVEEHGWQDVEFGRRWAARRDALSELVRRIKP